MRSPEPGDKGAPACRGLKRPNTAKFIIKKKHDARASGSRNGAPAPGPLFVRNGYRMPCAIALNAVPLSLDF
ncbi:hypothetical protein DESC_700044 [Desulfosarcina cetonica]|nr:hypothetical protein DESC_700044 [Desulfosarcina cetonica]